MAAKPPRRRRPALHEGTPASESVRIRVTAAQRLDLKRVAEENGTGISGIIREAVDEYVADYRERRVFLIQSSSCGTSH